MGIGKLIPSSWFSSLDRTSFEEKNTEFTGIDPQVIEKLFAKDPKDQAKNSLKILHDRSLVFETIQQVAGDLKDLVNKYSDLNEDTEPSLSNETDLRSRLLNELFIKGEVPKHFTEEDEAKITDAVNRLEALKALNLNSQLIRKASHIVKDYLNETASKTSQSQLEIYKELRDQVAQENRVNFKPLELIIIGRHDEDVLKRKAQELDLDISNFKFGDRLDSPFVSRLHALLKIDTQTGLCFIEDIGTKGKGSLNGTYIQRSGEDLPIRLEPRKKYVLELGDTFYVANDRKENSISISLATKGLDLVSQDGQRNNFGLVSIGVNNFVDPEHSMSFSAPLNRHVDKELCLIEGLLKNLILES